MQDEINIKFLACLQAALQGRYVKIVVEKEENNIARTVKTVSYAESTEGIDAIALTETELSYLLQLAEQQNVLPMICHAIYDTTLEQAFPQLVLPYKERAMQEVTEQVVRTAQFLDLYLFLKMRGLEPLVVKGLSVRNLYPNEHQRVSVDEDLLIAPTEVEQVHAALIAYGMELIDPAADISKKAEVSYIYKETGMYIEVHKELFEPGSEAYGAFNQYFAKRRTATFSAHKQQLKTLAPTDHLFFLICHALKHFLHSGFGIRYVADLVIYSETYVHQIDWARVQRQCEEVQAEQFVAAMYAIAQQYLLPENTCYGRIKDWDVDEIDPQPLLKDILDSGIHGASGLERLHSSNITLGAAAGRKKALLSEFGPITSSIFLPRKSMQGKYGYLKKFPFLLPIAWGQRVLSYIKETCISGKDQQNNDRGSENQGSKNQGSENQGSKNRGTQHKKTPALESIRIGKARVALLEKYGIIRK